MIQATRRKILISTQVGGGRIKRDDASKTISVYGYSKTFGRSPGCNEATAEMIRAALPGYRVDWSDEGY